MPVLLKSRDKSRDCVGFSSVGFSLRRKLLGTMRRDARRGWRRCFRWDRLQPVLLRSSSASSCASQDRKDCGVTNGAQARVPVPLKRTRSRAGQAFERDDALLRRRRLKPTLLKIVFACRRKLSPGLKVQVMFQTSTCTFALAVENYSPGARQMLHLRGTVENGTSRR
jgi:hypothetical protein